MNIEPSDSSSGMEPERIPNFLLSAPPTPTAAPAPAQMAPSPQAFNTPTTPFGRDYRAGNPTTPVTFNERLRAGGGYGTPGAMSTRHSQTPTTQTPSRMPPSRSLLDDTGMNSASAAIGSLSSSRNNNNTTPARPSSMAFPPGRPPPISFSTPANPQPLSNSDLDGLERWVTVFGFQPSMEAQVLREMRRHGDVLRSIGSRGNWTHVMYGTSVSAQVALYRPWRFLPGNTVMFGIVPCTEPDVARDAQARVTSAIASASPSSARRPTSMIMMSPSPAARHRTPSLRTPSSIYRNQHRDIPSIATPSSAAATPSSAVRTPQPQKGFFGYIADLYG